MNTLLESYRNRIGQFYLADESEMISELLGYLQDYDSAVIQQRAYSLVAAIRANKDKQTLVTAFLHEYQLSSEEGVVLMRIAEALLRIPDQHTQDLFLREKLTEADWHKHILHSDSLLVNFSTQALKITGKIEQKFQLNELHQLYSSLSTRLGSSVIRTALKQAMQLLANQFVIAETIDKALYQASKKPDYLYSFDLLGEAALTVSDSDRYLQAYAQAIDSLAKQAKNQNCYRNSGISIKLSALFCRYEAFKHKQAVKELSVKLVYLATKARAANITVTVDAEESERLEMSLDIFTQAIIDPAIQGWSGLGLAVQAYQKRAISTLQWLAVLAKSLHCKIPLRLVKGAYWDSEIKRAQVNGLAGYPVFTHKTATDVSYLACARFIISHSDVFYPQFATHNAHTAAAIMEMGRKLPSYEFQCLHGMGEELYNQILQQTNAMPCRIYAPVGHYQDLLPYLVRRLLENGANTSFINQIETPDISIDKITIDPVKHLKTSSQLVTGYPLPKELFAEQRLNSEGLNLADPAVIRQLQQRLSNLKNKTWQAAPLIDKAIVNGIKYQIRNPANNKDTVGTVTYSDKKTIKAAIDTAGSAFSQWRLTPAEERANYLNKTADLLEENRIELACLCIREAGKTIKDALSEIREAIDFCRYYASLAIKLFARPISLPGPTGENNQLFQYGRGIFVCISPWNFPIAIFIGQISAALASGNTVIAKPAAQTPLSAMRCIRLMHQAGIPEQVLHFLPGDGVAIGKYLLSDHRIAGVAFTGSLATAQHINQQLAKLPSIIPLIAETGGQNIMIADSSAHTEQLIEDIVSSAFNSAGQRCSALRVLFIADEIADKTISRLIEVMQLLVIADPYDMETVIGPVISQTAFEQLHAHVESMRKQADRVFQVPLEKYPDSQCFFPPTLIEISSLSQLNEEHFGPILHIIRYQADQLEQVITDINASAYGLTLGIHSRINSTINSIIKNSKVGNIYVNRNMISAVVGVQPFGGTGLSGTGPKAGGPHYLFRFCNEQTVTVNTTAIGGNVALLVKKRAIEK